jgi:hypothetical protein
MTGGDNILISNYDRYATRGDEFVAVVYIKERYSYTEVDGYRDVVEVQGNRAALRRAVTTALDYAREHGLNVQVNNRHVWEDMTAGVLDVSGLKIRNGAIGPYAPLEETA